MIRLLYLAVKLEFGPKGTLQWRPTVPSLRHLPATGRPLQRLGLFVEWAR